MYHLLVCGESFQGLCFAERDRARERLRFSLLLAGSIPAEHIWVWDATNQAQLLVNSYAAKNEAEARKESLQRAGLRCRIVNRLPG